MKTEKTGKTKIMKKDKKELMITCLTILATFLFAIFFFMYLNYNQFIERPLYYCFACLCMAVIVTFTKEFIEAIFNKTEKD